MTGLNYIRSTATSSENLSPVMLRFDAQEFKKS
jgi:hypothetical protein